MRYFEVEGDSPNEILDAFLTQQKLPKDYVEMEIVDAGSKGILGIGKKPAKVKIKFDDHEYYRRRAKLYLSDILDKAGFENYHIEVKDHNPDIIFNIQADDSNLLIGRSAVMLDSLQYLVDRVFKIDSASDIRLLVDVDNYRERVVEPLKEKAVRLAQSVKKSGRPAKMSPMATVVRREIHMAAKTVPGVSTVSHGEGIVKTITILPDRKPGDRKAPGGERRSKPFHKNGNKGGKQGNKRGDS